MNKSIIIRETLGLSQKELAGILNISCKRLSQFENETAVLPYEPNYELNYIYKYMKLALYDRITLNTLAYYILHRKAVEKQLKEIQKQHDLISTQLKKAERSYKKELAKKSFLRLLFKSNPSIRSFNDQKLKECLRKSHDSYEMDIKYNRIKLSVLNFEKGKLEWQLGQILLKIEFLERYPEERSGIASV